MTARGPARTSTPTANVVSESCVVEPPASDTLKRYCPAGSKPMSCTIHTGMLAKQFDSALWRVEGRNPLDGQGAVRHAGILSHCLANDALDARYVDTTMRDPQRTSGLMQGCHAVTVTYALPCRSSVRHCAQLTRR